MTNSFDWASAGKHWFEADKMYSRFVHALPPYDWLFIGTNPLDGMTKEFVCSIDLFVNVSDSPHEVLLSEKPHPGARMLWYPIAELSDWTYGPFFWSKQVLDAAHDQQLRTYLHCDAGVNRSPCLAMAWLTSRGHSLEDAALLLSRGDEQFAKTKISRYNRNIQFGFIPDRLSEFYARCLQYAAEGYPPDYDNILYAEPELVSLPEKFLIERGK